MTDAQPYLSIVVTGRNDDFGGDFNGRFFRAVRFNHDQLTRAGVSHEFVFVEWRPIDGRPFLTTLFAAAFPELGPGELQGYVIHPAYHDALSLNPRLQFQEFIAKNVGIRRARGQFVLTTNTDIYLGRGVTDCLASKELRDGVLYRAARCDLKSHADMSHVTWELLEDERNYDVVNVIRPPLFTNASGDFLLLDRESYHRLAGFNEVYRVAKIHIDGNFCMKALASGVPLVDIGFPVYHAGRGTLHAQRGFFEANPAAAPWGDIRWKSDVIYVNGPFWGLAAAPERRLDSRTSFIDYDSTAIGPMIELRRLVLPTARGSSPSPSSA